MVQSDQLTTDIPNYLPNRIAKGQQEDLDYQDSSDEQLYQVDGTVDIHTLLTNQMIIKIMRQIIIHTKYQERYVPQLMQLEKIWLKRDKPTN